MPSADTVWSAFVNRLHTGQEKRVFFIITASAKMSPSSYKPKEMQQISVRYGWVGILCFHAIEIIILWLMIDAFSRVVQCIYTINVWLLFFTTLTFFDSHK